MTMIDHLRLGKLQSKKEKEIAISSKIYYHKHICIHLYFRLGWMGHEVSAEVRVS